MEFIPIFPTLIGGEVLSSFSQDQIKNWLYYIKNSKLDQMIKDRDSNDYITRDVKIFDNPLFFELKNTIYKLAKKYIEEIGITIPDIQYSTSWGYLSGKGALEYNWHKHRNSLISGVFYLTYGGPIEFRSNHRDNFEFFIPMASEYDYNIDHFKITPEPNLLLLFPSHLDHSAVRGMTEERCSIAFNIIPKGEFGGKTIRLSL